MPITSSLGAVGLRSGSRPWPIIRGSSTANATGNLSISMPAETVTGDLLVVAWSVGGFEAAFSALPTGFSEAASTTTDGARIRIAVKVAASDDASKSYTFNYSGSAGTRAVAMAIRNSAANTNVLGASATNSAAGATLSTGTGPSAYRGNWPMRVDVFHMWTSTFVPAFSSYSGTGTLVQSVGTNAARLSVYATAQTLASNTAAATLAADTTAAWSAATFSIGN